MDRILHEYNPKNYAKGYVKIATSRQYPMFVATALGIKSAYDDFIDAGKYDLFVDLCEEYGLHVEPDIIFEKPAIPKESVVGAKNITTTFQMGRRFDRTQAEGRVHVFVSKSAQRAKEAKKWGWYSVVVNKRTINKPFIDHLRFGACLGFPSCCIDSFRKYNNWHVFSHPFEVYKNTLAGGRYSGSYHCNNFLMDHTYFLVHHLPCSYCCPATIELSQRIQQAIGSVEPDFVQKTISILRKPLLVFAEHNFIIFEGTIRGNAIEYTDCEYVSNKARPEESIHFFDVIKGGNTVYMDDNTLKVKTNNTTLFQTKRGLRWFMIGFE